MSGAQQYNTSSEEDVDDETQSRFVLVDDLDTLEVALDTLSGLDVQAISVDLEGEVNHAPLARVHIAA